MADGSLLVAPSLHHTAQHAGARYFLERLIQELPGVEAVEDVSIYSRDREMRLPYACKPNEKRISNWTQVHFCLQKHTDSLRMLWLHTLEEGRCMCCNCQPYNRQRPFAARAMHLQVAGATQTGHLLQRISHAQTLSSWSWIACGRKYTLPSTQNCRATSMTGQLHRDSHTLTAPTWVGVDIRTSSGTFQPGCQEMRFMHIATLQRQ